MITKEQFDILDKHSSLLLSVRKTHTYVGLDRSVLNELHNLHKELGYRSVNIGCGNCVINMLLTLGGLYVAHQDTFNNESEPTNDNTESKEPVTKKKSKRTKKQ